jgi:signal transduction histidine kinase
LADAFRQIRNLEGVRKIEMQIFVLNLACACLLVICSNLAGVFLNVEWLKRLGPIWFTALHGLTVWAVCYHRVFDAKQIVRSIGQRLLLLGLLGVAALAIDQTLDHFIHNFWSPFITAVVVCVIGIACDGPTRRWLKLDQGYLLLRPRRTIIDWARKISDEEGLKERFEQLLRDQCQTNSAILLLSYENSFSGLHLTLAGGWPGFAALCKEGWTTPETLQRSRPAEGTAECFEFLSRNQLGAILAVPRGSFPPSLVVALGQKASLRPYTYPDVKGLIELAELMDNILTHSRVSAHASRIEKLASAAMMSRGLAHDLRNLAAPISAFLLHMENKVTSDTLEAEVLNDAKHSLKVMQDYIQESLFFARQLVPHLAPVNIRGLLTSVLRLSRERAAAADIRVAIHCDESLILVADEALLTRLLQNLVFNSLDASPPGGLVELAAFVVEGNQVSLSVADHGPGIVPEIRDHIFEPYFTTKNTSKEHRGFGLGLAICQKIAELHGGRITMAPNMPNGSRFTVLLPANGAAQTTIVVDSDKLVKQTNDLIGPTPSPQPEATPS